MNASMDTSPIGIQELHNCVTEAASVDKACLLFQLVRRGTGYSCISIIVSMERWIHPGSTEQPPAHPASIPFSTISALLQKFEKQSFCVPFLNDLTLPGTLYQCSYFSTDCTMLRILETCISARPTHICGDWVPRCTLASQLQKSDYHDYDLFWDRA